MSNYNIDWQSNGLEAIPGKAQIILPQKVTNVTSTSLTLTGLGYPKYGEIQQENFIRLLENFASENPPTNPTIGQLWYNTTENILYIVIDAVAFGSFQPVYFEGTDVAWVQVFPNADKFATLGEYSPLAEAINKIIGTPVEDSPAAEDQWGWAQTDLVPEYDDVNTLKSGFSSATYPAKFNNTAWVILLARLRKALRHVDGAETDVSPVGFIDDGRPFPPTGSALSNSYNDNPAATTLPDFTCGWGNIGKVTLQTYYTNTVNALAYLENNRFNKAVLSTQSDTLSSFTRTDAWNSTKQHNITLDFVSASVAKAYFNSGGTLEFQWSLAPSVVDAFNSSWQLFLAAESGLSFYHDSTRRNNIAVFKDADTTANSPGESLSYGFYDLTTTPTTIYRRRREYDADDPTIDDSGLEVKAYLSNSGASVNFEIYFHEDTVTLGENVQGLTVSNLVGNMASSLNVNSPAVVQPVATQGGDFTL